MNEFIVSVGINKEMKACPQHTLACIQSAIYYHRNTASLGGCLEADWKLWPMIDFTGEDVTCGLDADNGVKESEKSREGWMERDSVKGTETLEGVRGKKTNVSFGEVPLAWNTI